MVFLFAAASYLLFLVLVCLFLKGGSIRKSPEPPGAHPEFDTSQAMQIEAPLAAVYTPEYLIEWTEEMSASTAPIAHPSPLGDVWQPHLHTSRL